MEGLPTAPVLVPLICLCCWAHGDILGLRLGGISELLCRRTGPPPSCWRTPTDVGGCASA
eukprot:15048132-Heterocapsa_arctica.AAC.1